MSTFHRYLAISVGGSGARGLHANAAYERSSSDSTVRELSCTMQCEKKKPVIPSRGCLHSHKLAVGFSCCGSELGWEQHVGRGFLF